MSFLCKVLYICDYFVPTHKPPEDLGEDWNLLGIEVQTEEFLRRIGLWFLRTSEFRDLGQNAVHHNGSYSKSNSYWLPSPPILCQKGG